MTRKLCTFAGCSAVVDHPDDGSPPRCDKHTIKQSSQARRQHEHRIDHLGRDIYNTSRWRRIRKLKAKHDPVCEKCQRKPMDVVDHIVELSDGGDPYLWDNLMSLCHSCHNSKTGYEKRRRKRDTGDFPKLSDF